MKFSTIQQIVQQAFETSTLTLDQEDTINTLMWQALDPADLEALDLLIEALLTGQIVTRFRIMAHAA